jgi:prepilin-type N-terminal cleavage/methylation domain-containing protein
MVRISQNDTGRSRSQAFTLIELLVVIAIIALLAAIIFPVFFTVRENARASSAMSNMHDISTKMEQYRLDHHAYPPVLFGYAVPAGGGAAVPMDKALDAATTAGTASTYFPGLYPAYISSVQEFQDPNDDAKLDKVVTLNNIPFLCTGGSGDDAACSSTAKGTLVSRAAATPQSSFYVADAFDTSPQVTGTNKVDANTPVLRYTTSYSGITSNGNSPAVTDTACDKLTGAAQTSCENSLYLRQLRWQFPPSDTYVTCSTWHVPQSNKVLFLTSDGVAKKMDVNDFLAKGPDVPLTVTTALDPGNGTTNVGVVASPIWRLHP